MGDELVAPKTITTLHAGLIHLHAGIVFPTRAAVTHHWLQQSAQEEGRA